MPVDMKALLALPQKERRKIAERLWKSLPDDDQSLQDEAAVVNLLEKRSNAVKAGKASLLSSEQFWSKVETKILKKKK
jgi:putative addiction module component (TIGR02574 family)